MKPTPSELARAQAWVQRHMQGAESPYSFLYGGRPSDELLATWDVERSSEKLDEKRTRTTVAWTDPQTGIELRCVATEHVDFPAVEWVLYLKNTRNEDSRLIEDIRALDVAAPVAADQGCTVHHAKGSNSAIDDFEPLETALAPSEDLRLAAHLGRSSNRVLPFFNIEMEGGGVICGVGWTGEWAATFARGHTALRVRAGMPETHLRLHPGEEIRSPRILLLFWEADRLHGHGVFRQLILRHYSPRTSADLPQMPICHGTWGAMPAQEHIDRARWWKDRDIPLDVLWIDAGWYGGSRSGEASDASDGDWQAQVGNWYPNEGTHPDGLRPIGDALKDMGYGFLLWIEPERARRETQLAREHPDWFYAPIGNDMLLNLGDPEARTALTDLVSSIIAEGGVTWYRQDFNIDLAPYWRVADLPDRIGMNDIRHIEGLYAFWDELLDRHPGLRIDNCASGGRRIDIEMMSRSVALWRSDFQCTDYFDSAGMQGQTYGLAPWVPLTAGATDRGGDYEFRSALGPGIVVTPAAWDQPLPPEDFPPDRLRTLVEQHVAARKFFYGDFYPLTPYNLAHTDWLAWQFDRPDLAEGIVQAFRRPECVDEARRLRLRGLDRHATYLVHDVDSDQSEEWTGASLMEPGVLVAVPEVPGAALLTYARR